MDPYSAASSRWRVLSPKVKEIWVPIFHDYNDGPEAKTFTETKTTGIERTKENTKEISTSIGFEVNKVFNFSVELLVFIKMSLLF